jgi:cytochrome c-type biogenesis protein
VLEISNVGIIAAFAAGAISFLSPCVLPLVPGYVSYIAGRSVAVQAGSGVAVAERLPAVGLSLCFVLGFSTVFVLLGASATALGRALNYYQIWVQRVGGILVILFGLLCLGVAPISLLRERRVHWERKPVGYLGSALVGMTFAAGWTPCIGPVLGGILGLAATSTEVGQGMLLLAVYSAGLALPFLLAAVAVESFLGWFQRFRPLLPWVMRVSGVMLIAVGLLLVTGEFTRLAGWLQGLTPDFLRERL